MQIEEITGTVIKLVEKVILDKPHGNIVEEKRQGVRQLMESYRTTDGLPMMCYVDEMLTAYENMCRAEGESRRWYVLYLRYIGAEKLSDRIIAQMLYIDKRTFYRDINRAIDDMAVLLFGLEALCTHRRSATAP